MGPYSCKSNTSRILKGKASTKIDREKDQMVKGGVVALGRFPKKYFFDSEEN
jgi:hypothetical protein